MARVLVIDDSPTQIFQVKEILEAHGHVVMTADNGRDGVALALAELPDLVLMDIVMPDMNGFQATRQLSRESTTKHIPVVIVSSKDQKTDKVWGERQGARGYLTKPVDTAELMGVIGGLL